MRKLRHLPAALLCALGLCACTAPLPVLKVLHPQIPALDLQPIPEQFCQRIVSEFTKLDETQIALCGSETTVSPATTPSVTSSTP